jgi:lipoate-protein ligase A
VRRPLALITDPPGSEPGWDAAAARALLDRVAAGAHPESLRIYIPGRVVAFGTRDAARPGYPLAVRATERAGFRAEQRLAGGRAAVFHEHTLAFAWAIREPRPRDTIGTRFEMLAEILIAALRELGVDARAGEVPGEYCPGPSSINARGRRKLVGSGQRLVASGAHVGGVIVVDCADLVNETLTPVYGALGYDWDPAATGAVADEVPATLDSVRSAVLAAFAERFDLVPSRLDEATRTLAAGLVPTVLPPRR